MTRIKGVEDNTFDATIKIMNEEDFENLIKFMAKNKYQWKDGEIVDEDNVPRWIDRMFFPYAVALNTKERRFVGWDAPSVYDTKQQQEAFYSKRLTMDTFLKQYEQQK